LCGLLDDPDEPARPFLDALDEILGLVECAAPLRWQSKRKAFRRLDSEEALLNLRSELAVASALVRGAVEFSFGDPARSNPDLVLRSHDFGIEVTSRIPWGLHHLYKALRDAVVDTGCSIHLRLSEYPVSMTEAEAMVLVGQARRVALRAPERGAGGVVHRKVLARIGLGADRRIDIQAQVLPVPSLMGGAKVTYETDAGELEGLKTVEQRIVDIANDPQKRCQGESMPTLLMVDATRYGPSWLRPPAVWAARLAELIPDGFPFSGLGVFLSDIDCAGVRDVAIATSSAADAESRLTIERLSIPFQSVRVETR
jgi:hypothetical protein